MRRSPWFLAALLVLLGLWLWSGGRAPAPAGSGAPAPVAGSAGDTAGYPAFLPAEAHAVLERIARGGPFEYRQDGGVFHNRERRLPPRPRGYYREYTVATPGSPDRGARRIVTGGQPPHEYWYTDDHYRSFRAFTVGTAEASR